MIITSNAITQSCNLRLVFIQSCSLSITLSVIGLAIYFLKYYQLCNLMTPDDTLCRVWRGCHFLFLLSVVNRMFNVKWNSYGDYQHWEKTFEELVSRLRQFVERMDSINRKRGSRRMSDWMDNQDVCQVLKISTRTLQTLRDSGRLPHSKINNRIYYRPEDVERLIEDCNYV